MTIWDQQGMTWFAELDEHWPLKPVMISIVSSIPTGGNSIFYWNISKPFDVLDLCCKRKP